MSYLRPGDDGVIYDQSGVGNPGEALANQGGQALDLERSTRRPPAGVLEIEHHTNAGTGSPGANNLTLYYCFTETQLAADELHIACDALKASKVATLVDNSDASASRRVAQTGRLVVTGRYLNVWWGLDQVAIASSVDFTVRFTPID